MGNRKTAINGISTTGVYKDGDCMMLKNLRQKNGRLVPVAPRKTVKTLGNGYTYLFYHNLPQTGENLLGVRDGDIYMIADGTESPLTSTTGFKSMTQIGNLVNVLDGDGVRVLWWSDDHYNVLGTRMDMCPVKVDLRVSNVIDSNNKTTLRYYRGSTLYSNIGDPNDTNDLKRQEYLGLISKSLSTNNEDGYLNGFMLACTAVELYDGSYILQSTPILLCQSFDKGTRYSNIQIRDRLCDYKNNKMIFYSGKYKDLLTNSKGYFEVNRDDFYNLLNGDKYSGGNYKIPIKTGIFQNVLGVHCYRGESDGYTINSDYLYCVTSLNKLQFNIEKNIDIKYSSLIKSISVFITKETNMQVYDTIDDILYTGKSAFVFDGFMWDEVRNFTTKTLSEKELTTSILSNQQFYKVHEITFDELQTLEPNKWIDIDLKDKLGDNLVNQEELPVDNYTHHGLLPNGQMVYNSKLHIWDYKQILFQGWPLEAMKANQGVGQFNDDNPSSTLTNCGCYTLVRIKTSNGTSEVVRYHNIGTLEKFMMGAMISYPDSRAFEMEIGYFHKIQMYGIWFWGKSSKTYKLIPSDTQNFSYYIQSEIKPFYAVDFLFIPSPNEITIPPEINRQQIYRNALKISSVNNPFNFPRDQTHTVGTGVILNAGTNAMRMSDGQFGQYPLYVFTTEGITSLDTGTTVAYNRQSSASLEIPVNTMICPTPFGVLFIGKRGLYVINGQQVQYLSAAIEENMLPNNIVTGWTNWEEWVLGLRLIAYDYQQHEIVLAGAAYNLIYNVDAKQWYISTEQVDGLVENTGSELKMYKRKSKTVITTPAWDEITTPAWDEIITPAWDEYTVTSHPAQRTANIIELNTDGGILSVRFQHAMNVGMIWGNVRLNDVDGRAYEDYQFQIIFSKEDCTQWITLGNININPDMNNVDMEFGDNGTYFYDGYKVGDDGNPNENGNYWKDTHYYIYWPQKNYPSNPVVNINIWDSVFVVHHYATIVHHDAVIVHHPAITTQVYLSDIKDFSQSEQTETSIELVTRPMTYESDERKNLLRMMLRGRMYNMTSNGQFVQVYGSNDGVNHTLLRAFTMPEARQGRDHKDLDFGAFARATYRNYVLRLVATIDEGSSIDYVESEVTDRWVNDKDR